MIVAPLESQWKLLDIGQIALVCCWTWQRGTQFKNIKYVGEYSEVNIKYSGGIPWID